MAVSSSGPSFRDITAGNQFWVALEGTEVEVVVVRKAKNGLIGCVAAAGDFGLELNDLLDSEVYAKLATDRLRAIWVRTEGLRPLKQAGKKVWKLPEHILTEEFLELFDPIFNKTERLETPNSTDGTRVEERLQVMERSGAARGKQLGNVEQMLKVLAAQRGPTQSSLRSSGLAEATGSKSKTKFTSPLLGGLQKHMKELHADSEESEGDLDTEESEEAAPDSKGIGSDARPDAVQALVNLQILKELQKLKKKGLRVRLVNIVDHQPWRLEASWPCSAPPPDVPTSSTLPQAVRGKSASQAGRREQPQTLALERLLLEDPAAFRSHDRHVEMPLLGLRGPRARNLGTPRPVQDVLGTASEKPPPIGNRWGRLVECRPPPASGGPAGRRRLRRRSGGASGLPRLQVSGQRASQEELQEARGWGGPGRGGREGQEGRRAAEAASEPA